VVPLLRGFCGVLVDVLGPGIKHFLEFDKQLLLIEIVDYFQSGIKQGQLSCKYFWGKLHESKML